MTETIIVAVLSLVGTFIGTLGGILGANKLVVYRIDQLEKKVEKHNNVIERVFQIEKQLAVDEEEIEHLKGYHKQN